MKVKDVLKKLDFSLDKEEVKTLSKKTKELTDKIKSIVKKEKIKAEVFVGGSFGKGTLEKSDLYDIDIFVRFEKSYKELSEKLEGILNKADMKAEKVHGSRDYFRILDGKIVFELIPVLKIKKPTDADNVTDLSYFHVNFVKKNINKKIRREIGITKKFCKAAGVYGAESYVNGFSGYAVECSMIYFKSFEKMINELLKVKEGEKKIIDIKKFYKKKEEISFRMNESKLKSPVVLVDPTWKERNILAALNDETFRNFQKTAREFLKNPSEMFFVVREKNFNEFKKNSNGEALQVVIKTDRQEGDIAGTKMKKFSRFLLEEIRKYFEVVKMEFHYNYEKTGELFVLAKSRGEIVRKGPLTKDEKNSARFKKANDDVFEKEGVLYSRQKIDFTLEEFLKRLRERDAEKTKEMGITDFEIFR
jgi:tRNA nucleotidyltransferase (CCA-adding enzyme)